MVLKTVTMVQQMGRQGVMPAERTGPLGSILVEAPLVALAGYMAGAFLPDIWDKPMVQAGKNDFILDLEVLEKGDRWWKVRLQGGSIVSVFFIPGENPEIVVKTPHGPISLVCLLGHNQMLRSVGLSSSHEDPTFLNAIQRSMGYSRMYDLNYEKARADIEAACFAWEFNSPSNAHEIAGVRAQLLNSNNYEHAYPLIEHARARIPPSYMAMRPNFGYELHQGIPIAHHVLRQLYLGTRPSHKKNSVSGLQTDRDLAEFDLD